VRDDTDVGHDAAFAVRWRNFRAFHDTGWVTLKPLTVLLGANSAGKSSFIAPLLLLKQSTFSRTGSNALLTRGDYLDVGVYDDFVRDHDSSLEVSMGLRWHSHAPEAGLSALGRFPPGGLSVSFGPGDDTQTVVVRAFRVEDTYRRVMLTRLLQPDGSYSLRMFRAPEASSRGKRADAAEVARRNAMREAMADAQPVDFLFPSRAVRRAGLDVARSADRPTFSTTIDDDRARLYCSVTDHTEWGVLSILDRLHYIGPLREEPKRVYELSGEMPAEVGTRGEFAPEIVYRWRNNKRRMREVRKWLRHFGFDEELTFRTVGTGGFALVLVRDGAPVASTFVDTGFGMSQVLPLVVQGLLAEPGDCIIVEQPEIHLNPRLQAALADLFAEIAARDVGLIIESHSEHLLLRLRRLLAQERIESDALGLYFVEQVDGVSTIREVAVDDAGYIDSEDWPKGFFADSLRESMELAEQQQRRRRRDQRRQQQASREQAEQENVEP
jgi:hypothetical protein